jgi:hypothetical protein
MTEAFEARWRRFSLGVVLRFAHFQNCLMINDLLPVHFSFSVSFFL